MSHRPKRAGANILCLIVGLALLGCTRMSAAQGTWSVIATPGSALGQVQYPSALTVDNAGNLYVGDGGYPLDSYRVQKRDAQGNWSVIAANGDALREVIDSWALAVDAAGNLYVAEVWSNDGRIQKRDAQGNWSVIAANGDGLGQVTNPTALAADPAGNLYVADFARIQKRDAQGSWSVIATLGNELGPSGALDASVTALAVDVVGNLYVTGYYHIHNALFEERQLLWVTQKRDAQGNWSVFDTDYTASALAADAAGDLYAADGGGLEGQIALWGAQGNWSVIATYGRAVGQVEIDGTSGLAVDGAGNLYVADTGNNRVQKYTPGP